MGDDQLIAFINSSRTKGRTDEQIIRSLLAVGWKKEKIDAALREATDADASSPPQQQTAKPAEAAQPKSPPWVSQASLAAKPTQPQASSQEQSARLSTTQAQQQSQVQKTLQEQTAPLQGTSIAGQPTAAATASQQSPAQPVAAATQTQPTIQEQPATVSAPSQKPVSKKPLFPFPQFSFGKKSSTDQSAKTSVTPSQSPPRQSPMGQFPFQPKKTDANATPSIPPQSQTPIVAQPPSSSSPPQTQQSPMGQFPFQPKKTDANATPNIPPQSQIPISAQPPQQAPAVPVQTAAQAPPQANDALATLKKNKFLPFILIALVGVLLAASAYYVFFSGAGNSNPPIAAVPEVPREPHIVPNEGAAEQPGQPQNTPGLQDCKTNIDCFIQKSITCAPAKMTYTSEITMFDVVSSTTSNLEIAGLDGGKCVFKTKTTGSTVRYGEGMVQQMLEQGLTRSEISQSEAEAAHQAALAIGSENTCLFNMPALSAMLERWKAGSYSTNDFSSATCNSTMPEDNNLPVVVEEPVPEMIQELPSSPNLLPPEQEILPPVTTPPTQSPPSQSPSQPQAPLAPVPEQETEFSTVKQFMSSGIYSPSVFCANTNNGTFTSVHYKEYWGGECINAKGKDGTLNSSEFPSKCERIPCCLKGPFNEYSMRYDYFECGYYS